MRKTILTILATALLTATTVQFAAAAERHQGRKAVRLTTPASDPLRLPTAVRTASMTYASEVTAMSVFLSRDTAENDG